MGLVTYVINNKQLQTFNHQINNAISFRAKPTKFNIFFLQKGQIHKIYSQIHLGPNPLNLDYFAYKKTLLVGKA